MLPHGQCEAAMCAGWGGGRGWAGWEATAQWCGPGHWAEDGSLDTWTPAAPRLDTIYQGWAILYYLFLLDFSSGWKIIILKVNVLFNI